jgi:hypothetical protein
MTRKEKIEELKRNGIEISEKSNSERVNKRYADFLHAKLLYYTAQKQIEKNKRRNQKAKNEKIKKQKLKEPIMNKKTVTCFSCNCEFKRRKTVYKRIAIQGTLQVGVRFCHECLERGKNGIKTKQNKRIKGIDNTWPKQIPNRV